MFGLVGWITTRAIDRESPSPVKCQVRPPSVDLCRPFPHDCDRSELRSPVPTQTMLVSLGATAMSPTVWLRSESPICRQVVPALEVFQTPPPAAPTYIVLRYGVGMAS